VGLVNQTDSNDDPELMDTGGSSPGSSGSNCLGHAVRIFDCESVLTLILIATLPESGI
jgi:hypothetical protein